MRKAGFSLLCLLYFTAAFSQQLTVKEKHDRATDLTADALFGPASIALRDQQGSFEKAHSIKLHFTVDGATLDQVGGLSEYLFKIYKTIVSPVNVNVRTITGEFGLLDNGVLSDIVKYRSNATPDLRACILPPGETARMDSLYTLGLAAQTIGTGDLNEFPHSIDGVLLQAGRDYSKILGDHASCDAISNSTYDIYVRNTRPGRKTDWTNDAEAIRLQVSLNLGMLANEPGSTSGNNGSTGVDLKIDPQKFSGKHIINLNQSLNACTENDMEVRCRMLMKKTGIRFVFLTKNIDYFIPRDSMNVFRDAAAASFSSNVTEDRIIALYLRMHDATTGKNGMVLLVKQINGEWLSNADIAFAAGNNGEQYQAGTFFRFNNLFKNIPKPLTLCYQVAKVNGVLTTAYLEKEQSVKGKEQMYYHVFKADKAFDEIRQYGSDIAALYQSSGSSGGSILGTGGITNTGPIFEQIAELRLKQKIAYLKAARSPQFNEADIHFKEIYLQDSNLVKAAALKYIEQKYGELYRNNQFRALIANASIPSGMNAGTCATSDRSDAIADVLGVSSLLLSPVGLDFVPDGLSVAYFAATDETADMLLASASFFMPGSLCGAKRILNGTSDALESINKGSKLITEQGVTKAIDPDIGHLTAFFALERNRVDAGLVSKINNAPAVTKKLIGHDVACCLPVTSAQATLWKNTEKLPAGKRVDFVKKCYDDDAFRNKCLVDGDEVLRWGGMKLLLSWKKGWNQNRVLGIAKGVRPNPSVYLEENYIQEHLANFAGGVTKIVTSIPSGNIGPLSGTFVLPKNLADKLIEESAGSVRKLEELLGLDAGYLGNAAYRLDVTTPLNIRMSDGNELGANTFWIPGGLTSGGIMEATIDQIKEGTYTFKKIF
jgi:hypothetical protein